MRGEDLQLIDKKLPLFALRLATTPLSDASLTRASNTC
jgi:hypothetical protein